MTTPHRHRELNRIAREIASKFRAALWDENRKRRAVAVLNAKVRALADAKQIEPGWTAVIVMTAAGADVQYTRAA